MVRHEDALCWGDATLRAAEQGGEQLKAALELRAT